MVLPQFFPLHPPPPDQAGAVTRLTFDTQWSPPRTAQHENQALFRDACGSCVCTTLCVSSVGFLCAQPRLLSTPEGLFRSLEC